jgi:hypothetical protein
MRVIDLFFLLATVIVGIVATAGYGVLSLHPADFRIAKRCFWAAALGFATIGIVWGATTLEAMWIIRVLVVGLIGGIAAIGLSESLRWVSHRESASTHATTTSSTSNDAETDAQIVFECRLSELPSNVPPGGRIFYMPLFYSQESAVKPIGLAFRDGQPGAEWQWFPDTKFAQIYRCEMINYGRDPLLQVSLMFKVEYREINQNEDKSVSTAGKSVHVEEWPIFLSRIDPGKDNTSAFYIYNQSSFYAYVIPPNDGYYTSLSDRSVHRAALLNVGMTAGMGLWPAEKKQ